MTVSSHDLARQLLALPDGDVLVAIDTQHCGPATWLRAVSGLHLDPADATHPRHAVVLDTPAGDDPACYAH